MAGGLKKRRKRTIEGEASIDGVTLHWELISEPQRISNVENNGYKGMCITVRVVGEARRELIIEYPFPRTAAGFPQFLPIRPDVTPKRVEASIRQAIDAGWDLSSRGKAFVFHPPRDS
jgi:hypothetical protein